MVSPLRTELLAHDDTSGHLLQLCMKPAKIMFQLLLAPAPILTSAGPTKSLPSWGPTTSVLQAIAAQDGGQLSMPTIQCGMGKDVALIVAAAS